MKREGSSVRVHNPFMSNVAGKSASQGAGASAAEDVEDFGKKPAARVTRASPAGCTCRYEYLTLLIRMLSGLTCAAMGVAGGWAVYQCTKLYADAADKAVPPACQTAGFVDQKQFAIFLGLIGVYFCIFAILGICAEIRTDFLRRTVLKPFGFMQMWIGRGIFYIILGSLMIELPIDSELSNTAHRYITAIIPSVFLIVTGAAQILVSIFIRKEKGVVHAGAIPRAVSRKGGVELSPAAKIKWGGAQADQSAEPEEPASTEATEARDIIVDVSHSSSDAAPASTPSKKPLLALPAKPSAVGNPFTQQR